MGTRITTSSLGSRERTSGSPASRPGRRWIRRKTWSSPARGRSPAFGGNAVAIEDLNEEPLIMEGQLLSRLLDEPRRNLLVGIDPGSRIGLAMFYGGRELGALTMNSVEESGWFVGRRSRRKCLIRRSRSRLAAANRGLPCAWLASCAKGCRLRPPSKSSMSRGRPQASAGRSVPPETSEPRRG